MFEIAGGIILAVLFFVFLPQILALGVMAIALILLIAGVLISVHLASESPTLLGLVVFSGVILLTYWYFEKRSAFARIGIPGLLENILRMRLPTVTTSRFLSLRMKPWSAVVTEQGASISM